MSVRARLESGDGLLPVYLHGEQRFERAFERLRHKRRAGQRRLDEQVRAVVDAVRRGGDRKVLAYTKQFDGASLTRLEVTREEWDEACACVAPADRAALSHAIKRVRAFHRRRVPTSWEFSESDGRLGQRVRPLARVGIYVPGGKARYPSTVVMNAAPAAVARVPEILMATPPGRDGRLDPVVLLAARLAGVQRVFKMGGAQAVAALAFGTESVPGVDKIVGPGNAFVQAAKRLLFGVVDIDSEAGPTEVLVVADASARAAWVAADLISQAEHEEQAQALLITTLPRLARRVNAALEAQLRGLERERIARRALERNGAIFVVPGLTRALALADAYAPEHLVLAVADPDAALERVANAGTVFLGHHTPVAVGDYLAGPNHVLPTGGTARFFSPLGTQDFLKRTAFVKFGPSRLGALGADAIRLARLEGFTAHGASISLRLRGDAARRSRKRRG